MKICGWKNTLLALFLGCATTVAGAQAEGEQSPSSGQQPPQEAPVPTRSFVNPGRTDALIDSLSDTMRDSSADQSGRLKKVIMSVLDVRLPLIFETCDSPINFEILRIAYAYVSGKIGAEFELKRFADAIYKKPENGYQGVSRKCSAALRGFSIAVLQIYLGNEWNNDEDKGNRPQVNKEQNIP